MCHVTINRDISPYNFLLARAARILPLYWLLSLLACIVYLTEPSLVNSSGGTTTIINSFTLIPTTQKFLIQNGWTLSYEFLFYFIFSISLGAWCKNRVALVTTIIGTLVALGIATSPTNVMLRFLTSDMLLEFFAGIFAFVYINSRQKNIILNGVLIFFALSVLFIASLAPHTGQRVAWYGMPYAVLFAGLVSMEHIIRFTSTWFVGRTMKVIGDASFSIYLSHPFVLSAVGLILKKLHLQTFSALSLISMVTAALFVGYICFTLIESKLNHLTRKFLNTPNRLRDESTRQP